MTRKTILDIQKMKTQGEKIVLLTAYDATSARVAEAANIPVILVGDTLGMVIQGHSSTIPVTLDHMIYHCAIVARVTQAPLIVGDMPFMTSSISPEDTLRQAARLIQEGGVTAVKLEGGVSAAPSIQRLTQVGIPVMAHIGLTPQSVNQFGGFKVQGRQLEGARQLVRDADAIQAAGAFAVVLELVPAPLAALITRRLSIPTIGIGAGPDCDGQVQVFHDILGLFDQFLPRHAKRYAEIGEAMRNAAAQYRQDVQDGTFPSTEQAFGMSSEVLSQLMETLHHADR